MLPHVQGRSIKTALLLGKVNWEQSHSMPLYSVAAVADQASTPLLILIVFSVPRPRRSGQQTRDLPCGHAHEPSRRLHHRPARRPERPHSSHHVQTVRSAPTSTSSTDGHFNREKTIDRQPHAKVSGAFAVETTGRLRLSQGALFQKGASPRCSPLLDVAGEQAAPTPGATCAALASNSTRTRAFDLFGNNTRFFFVRDPMSSRLHPQPERLPDQACATTTCSGISGPTIRRARTRLPI